MRQLADDVFQLPLTPRNGINAYLIGDTLVDAGLPPHGKRLAKQLAGRVQRHVLTHAHGDHAGGSKNLVEALGVPFLVGAGDAEAARTGVPVTKLGAFGRATAGFPGLPVDGELREGDTVGGELAHARNLLAGRIQVAAERIGAAPFSVPLPYASPEGESRPCPGPR